MISRLLIFVARLRGLFARQKEERELNDEIRMHLRLLTDQFIARGMSPIDAASAARRQFGNTTLLEEDRRDQRSFRLLEALWRDVRYGARQLHRNPLFTTVAVVTSAPSHSGRCEPTNGRRVASLYGGHSASPRSRWQKLYLPP